MLKRSGFFVLTLPVLLPATVFAKPKTKVYDNTLDEVFTAALKTPLAILKLSPGKHAIRILRLGIRHGARV